MRAFVLVAILALAVPAASAQDATKTDPQFAPNAQSDPQAAPEARESAELEAMMKLKAFAKALDDAGFKEVQIVPQAVLVSAKDKSDKPVMLIFDTQTMVAVQLQPPPHQSETTGSGSGEDRNEKKPDSGESPGSGTNPDDSGPGR